MGIYNIYKHMTEPCDLETGRHLETGRLCLQEKEVFDFDNLVMPMMHGTFWGPVLGHILWISMGHVVSGQGIQQPQVPAVWDIFRETMGWTKVRGNPS